MKKTSEVVLSSRLAKALDILNYCKVTGSACIRSSLAVRDYLIGVGFPAKVMPVGVIVEASECGKTLHSVGVGVSAILTTLGHKLPTNCVPNGWDGHLVVIVKDDNGEKLLIDPTIGQTRRIAWPDLPSMIITSIIASGNRHKYNGCMATLANDNKNRPGYLLTISWYANPRNNIWRNAPEADPDLRNELVQRMIQASKH